MPKKSNGKLNGKNSKTDKKETLHDLLINKIKVLYDVENEITKALPQMAKAASNSDLKQGFEHHLEETEGQIERLEQIFEHLSMNPEKLESEAIRGLVKDGEWVIKNVKDKKALDANLIAAAQYVEHYEIAGYGTAIEWAKEMGHDEIQKLLEETLEEESHTNEELTKMATSGINSEANDM